MPENSIPTLPVTGTGSDLGAEATRSDTDDRALWRVATLAPEDTRAPGEVAPALGDAVPSAAERYQIQEVIGAGGMGEVRLCRDGAIGRDVAHKSLLEAHGVSERAMRRFLREARVQGQLEHPSIVPVYDLGSGPDGRLFFTMRRVRGSTLEGVIEALADGDAATAASFSRGRLLEAFARVCLAVDYAHARGVIHRDLKPANIMLGEFGEVYVLDWGVAKLVTERATDAPVILGVDGHGQGSAVGTPGYMSPEQVLGFGEAQDARTDVYALGVILFEILTLRPLYRGDAREELARLAGRPPPFTDADGVPPELSALCARALAFDPRERCAGTRDLAWAVERYLDGDRDLLRRRALARERAAAAVAAFASAESSETARADAMREVTAALALDPENAEARQLLVRLFVEVPSRLPPGVLAEMEATTQKDGRDYLRIAFPGVATWLLFPVVLGMIGVRAWAPVLLATAFVAASVLCMALTIRSGRVTTARIHLFSGMALAAVATASCFMGPFVVVPQSASIITFYTALLHRTGRQRWVTAAAGGAAVAIPFLVEILGLVPPAFAFSGGDVTLFGRVVRFTQDTTIPLLLYSSVGTVVAPVAVFSIVRDALSTAERRLFLQAWHLRQLLPG
jgi:eukaryotic-like serine/threonine-protein kinase